MDVDMDVDILVPSGPDISPEEREQRRDAIKKFMERKRIAQLTEQLRARLAFASFKASHGYSSIPFSKLDPLIDQEIAARSPSPSQASSATSASTGRRNSRTKARPYSYHSGAAAQRGGSLYKDGRVPPLNGSLSAASSPVLDGFPHHNGAVPAPGSLYLALFGGQEVGLGVSPLKHSPSLNSMPVTNGRKRTLNAAGSLPPPDSPRKHRRTGGSASFSHPPRRDGSMQEEEANAAAILTSILQSSQDSSQSTKSSGHNVSRTSSASSSGPGQSRERDEKAPVNGLGLGPAFAPQAASSSSTDGGPRTPPRNKEPVMDAAMTLVSLASSPSPARPSRGSQFTPLSTSISASAGRVLFPPTTPARTSQPQGNSNNTHGTPFGFSLSDYVNVSPSPAAVAGPFRGAVGGEPSGQGLAGLQPPPGIY